MSLKSRLEGLVTDSVGTRWHFVCIVVGIAIGYLTRPEMDAFGLWWRSQVAS